MKKSDKQSAATDGPDNKTKAPSAPPLTKKPRVTERVAEENLTIIGDKSGGGSNADT